MTSTATVEVGLQLETNLLNMIGVHRDILIILFNSNDQGVTPNDHVIS